MNEDIEKLKEKLKKILENYEIDKKIGQLSVDSIYHMFPTESEALLNYLEQLQNNWNELKKWLRTRINTDKDYERYAHVKEKLAVEDYVIKQVILYMQELEGNHE